MNVSNYIKLCSVIQEELRHKKINTDAAKWAHLYSGPYILGTSELSYKIEFHFGVALYQSGFFRETQPIGYLHASNNRFLSGIGSYDCVGWPLCQLETQAKVNVAVLSQKSLGQSRRLENQKGFPCCSFEEKFCLLWENSSLHLRFSTDWMKHT